MTTTLKNNDQAVSYIRANKPIAENWKEEIDADFARRGKNGKK